MEKNYFVHPTAAVDEPAEIGEGTKIWHHAHVLKGAKIGKNCVLGQNVSVASKVVIGNGVKMQNNVNVYDEVYLEDDVFCGPSMTFTNVINPRAFVERKHEYLKTVVRKGASMGAHSTIVCGVELGEYCFIGAGAVVIRDVPAYALMVGNPARRVGWVSRNGQRLHFKGNRATCPVTGEVYEMDGPDRIKMVGNEVIDNVPLLDLKAQHRTIKEQVEGAVKAVLDEQYFILGPRVKAFEARCAAYCGTKYAVGVSSGTDALLIALMALDIGPGDEVITTPFTFFATAGSVARLGAKLVFCDIDPATYNIDPAKLEALVTSKTKAIIPVHLFGQCAEMDAINAIANKHKIAVIEDGAQAIGSEYKGKRAGCLSLIGCFSFFPSKNLGGAGDGGMVTTNDEALYNKLVKLRGHGSAPKYYHSMIGGNFRLDALQAAILDVKLNHLEAWHAGRKRNADKYRNLLADLAKSGKITLPLEVEGMRHIYNQFSLRIHGGKRDDLMKFFKTKNIGCEVYYPVPMHIQECFKDLGYQNGDMPHSELAALEALALPIYPELTDAQMQYVSDALHAFFA